MWAKGHSGLALKKKKKELINNMGPWVFSLVCSNQTMHKIQTLCCNDVMFLLVMGYLFAMYVFGSRDQSMELLQV